MGWLACVSAVAVSILSIWIAIEKVLPLSLFFRVSDHFTTRLAGRIHHWARDASRDTIGILPCCRFSQEGKGDARI
jgi:hypothetical protein